MNPKCVKGGGVRQQIVMATVNAQALLIVNGIALGWSMQNREAVSGMVDTFWKHIMKGEKLFEP